MTANAGGAPLAIHSGGAPVTPINLVRVRHGRTYCEVVKVAWQLRDVGDRSFSIFLHFTLF